LAVCFFTGLLKVNHENKCNGSMKKAMIEVYLQHYTNAKRNEETDTGNIIGSCTGWSSSSALHRI
jgi:hypothetical protein